MSLSASGKQESVSDKGEVATNEAATIGVINLEKHFLAKQIRNRRRLRQEPGALVLLRVFNPREPA